MSKHCDNSIGLVGQRFGRWTVIARIRASKETRYFCKCDCGGVGEIYQSNLTQGTSTSCGCLQKEGLVIRSSGRRNPMCRKRNRKNLSKRMLGNRLRCGCKDSEKTKSLKSKAMIGNKHLLRHKHSEESKSKISKSLVGKRTGEKCNFWKGGNNKIKYGPGWTEHKREQIRKRDKYLCQKCRVKQQQRKLDVHHIDYNKNNNNDKNLISLCQPCHMEAGSNRATWTKFFKKKIIQIYKKIGE